MFNLNLSERMSDNLITDDISPLILRRYCPFKLNADIHNLCRETIHEEAALR
jgi:hypothetical protein